VIEEGANVGYEPQIARTPDGSFGVAYLRKSGDAAQCTKVDPPSPLPIFEVAYAGADLEPQKAATTQLISHEGLALAFDDGGEPAIAYQGGAENFARCGGTDLVVARRSGGAWSTATVDGDGTGTVYFPADQKACAFYQNTCNTAGADGVVGAWPAIAFPGGQLLAAYRDNHFGFAQDDEREADLEVGWNGAITTLDATFGGGLYTRVALDGSGNPVIAHYNPYETTGIPDVAVVHAGFWVIRWDGSKWIKGDRDGQPAVRKATSDRFGAGLGFAVSADRMALAFHDEKNERLRYTESKDGGLTWSAPETADQSGNTGRIPSLAFDAQGRPAIAYYHCGPHDPASSTCKPGEDALKITVKTANGWKSRTVSARGTFTEATGIGLTFDAEGKAVIAFQSQTFDPESGEAIRQIVVAREVVK
jgi:hypothetical protein